MTYDVDVARGAELLARGGLVAIPTETVYGLGADAHQPEAVRRIFVVKGRPTSHPLIVHLAHVEALTHWARTIPPFARRLADVLMPGPLTLILPRADHVSDAVTGGRDTVGLRVPRHPLAIALIDALSRARGESHAGIAAPSANRFGSVSPTTAAHVHADLEGEDVGVLDGGPCEVGLESTIVDCASEDAGPSILRVGGIARELIEEVLGAPVPLATDGPSRAPGMMASHYAPRARVVIATGETIDDAIARARASGLRVASLARRATHADRSITMSTNDAALARDLYATLRALDGEGLDVIVVELPDPRGLGLAIADRLTRASR